MQGAEFDLAGGACSGERFDVLDSDFGVGEERPGDGLGAGVNGEFLDGAASGGAGRAYPVVVVAGWIGHGGWFLSGRAG